MVPCKFRIGDRCSLVSTTNGLNQVTEATCDACPIPKDPCVYLKVIKFELIFTLGGFPMVNLKVRCEKGFIEEINSIALIKSCTRDKCINQCGC